VVICLEQDTNDLHMDLLMPLPPHDLLLPQNPDWFNLSGASLPGCPGKEAVKTDVFCHVKDSIVHRATLHVRSFWPIIFTISRMKQSA